MCDCATRTCRALGNAAAHKHVLHEPGLNARARNRVLRVGAARACVEPREMPAAAGAKAAAGKKTTERKSGMDTGRALDVNKNENKL